MPGFCEKATGQPRTLPQHSSRRVPVEIDREYIEAGGQVGFQLGPGGNFLGSGRLAKKDNVAGSTGRTGLGDGGDRQEKQQRE